MSEVMENVETRGIESLMFCWPISDFPCRKLGVALPEPYPGYPRTTFPASPRFAAL